jgi:hypothetical protein
MALAIRAALGEHEGSLLAFLPGVAEIERARPRPSGASLLTSRSTSRTAGSNLALSARLLLHLQPAGANSSYRPASQNERHA